MNNAIEVRDVKEVIIKDAAIESIKFTPNTLILLKRTESVRNDGTITTTTRYIELSQVKDNKDTTLVSTLLVYLLADYRNRMKFNSKHAEANVKEREIVKKYLRTTALYKSDSNGLLKKALISDRLFSDTACRLSPTHTLVTASPANLKAALYRHSLAVIDQCNYVSMLSDNVREIFAIINEKEIKAIEEKKQETAAKKAAPTAAKKAAPTAA